MAYLRARRSIKVAPGFKVNLNKRSVGVTVGTRCAHYSVNTSGRRTPTVGVPGTGLSVVDYQGGRRTSRPAAKPAARSANPKPSSATGVKRHAGVFASHHERAYAKALDQLRKGKLTDAYALLDDAIASDTKHEASAAHLVAGIAHFKQGDLDAAIEHLEPVVSTHLDPHEEQLLHRYELPDGYARFDVQIGQLQATAGTSGEAPVYLLAAAYANAGRLKEAAGLMQKLVAEHDPHDPIEPFPLIILCEIYQQLGDWDEIIHLVAHFNITNVDDGTLVLRSYQAIAMANGDLTDAALEVLKDCLKSTKRNPGLLHTARYARAQLYKNAGKKALAKRDLSRIYAEDPTTYAELATEIKELDESASSRPKR
jgi:tetratricopeptide (TPR) repeat protein